MAALTLQRIAGDTWFIPAPTNVGVYARDGRAVLIDSGNDKESGRQVLKLLKEQGLNLDLILNTHSNADHIGGNAFLQQKTGCRVAATALEAPFVEHPVLDPSFLYGGYPHAGLRNKFLMADPSRVTDVISERGPVLDTGLEAVPLPGHFFGMIGVATPDRVFFPADSVFSEEIIRKYRVVFLLDVAAQLETLDLLGRIEAECFVPSHGRPTADIRSLAEANRAAIDGTAGLVVSCCRTAATVDEILEQVCLRFGIELNAAQHVLVGSTVRSYLSWLGDRGLVEPRFARGRLLWEAR